MSKISKRNIPFKNYIIVFIIMVGIVFLTLYLFGGKENLVQSDLYRIIYEIQYDELDSSVFEETSDNYFIYISYLDDNEVAKLEEKVKNIIVDNNLQTSFYYLNATTLKETDNFVNDLNKKLSLEELQIENLPAIIFYHNNEVEKVISSKANKTFNIKELNNIIKAYELQD